MNTFTPVKHQLMMWKEYIYVSQPEIIALFAFLLPTSGSGAALLTLQRGRADRSRVQVAKALFPHHPHPFYSVSHRFILTLILIHYHSFRHNLWICGVIKHIEQANVYFNL